MLLYFYILPTLICLISHNYAVYKDPYTHTKFDFVFYNILSLIPIVNIFITLLIVATFISTSKRIKLFVEWLNSPLSNKPRT